MTLRDPHLALTALLAPVRRFSTTAPPWPAVATDIFGAPRSQAVDPVEAVLYGPIPRRRLAVASGPGDLRAQLVGLGDALAISVVARRVGDEMDYAPRAELRAAAAGVLVSGFASPDGGDAGSPDEVTPEALAARLGADPEWELLGFAEVLTSLVEGIPGDRPGGGAWAETGAGRRGRARGGGAGHAAWEIRGHFSSESGRSVVERRLLTIREGFGARVPPTVEFAAAALRWSRSARRALGQAGALDDLVDTVRAAVSTAVTSPASAEADGDLAGLAARLEILRVGLVEELEVLRGLRPRLARSVSRIFGDSAPASAGPFAEGGADGGRVIEALEGREASASRWAGALKAARGG